MSDCADWEKIDLNDSGNCDLWESINDSVESDWDSPTSICWILDSGAWSDVCFWRDLSQWKDAEKFWSRVA